MFDADAAREQYYNHRKKVIERKVNTVLKINKVLKTKKRYIWLKDDDLPYLSSWIESLHYRVEKAFTFFGTKRFKMYW